jgi:hypothetical protein
MTYTVTLTPFQTPQINKQSNQVIMTSVYSTPPLQRQIFCGID